MAGELVQLSIDLGAFNAMLNKFLDMTGSGVVDVLTAQALDLQAKVQQKTPVDTGRLRNSIHTVPPSNSSDAFPYSDSPRDGRERRSFEGGLAVSTNLYEAIVGTNVNYGAIVEMGSSRQAPNGMFAVSVVEKTGDLEQVINDMIQEEWDKRG